MSEVQVISGAGLAPEPPVKWLTPAELQSWISLIRLVIWLPWSIDHQLRRDSDLAMVEYQVLARLSGSPEHTMRMSSLASLTNASLSRLSHLIQRLEGRGLVRREPDAEDGRFTNAILTDLGFQTLAAAAPGHVAHVRSLVIDVLSPEQLRRLGQAADRIMSHIDTSAINSAGHADPLSPSAAHSPPRTSGEPPAGFAPTASGASADLMGGPVSSSGVARRLTGGGRRWCLGRVPACVR